MSGNDDFFGGSITPPPPPSGFAPRGGVNPHMAQNQEYAAYGMAAGPTSRATNTRLPLIVSALVLAVVSSAGLAAYRVMFGGTQIHIPDTLMGMERVDTSDPSAQQLEQSVEDLRSEVGDVDVEVAVFQSQSQMLFVMGGEAGTDDVAGGAADFFAGFEDGMSQSGQTTHLTLVDPGPKGGQMKCLELPTAGTCAWIDNDTFGAFAMAPLSGSAAETAQEIRAEIEK
ncbi:MAG: hypothetical protein ACJ73J_07210 [Actinomycetes bacterium]